MFKTNLFEERNAYQAPSVYVVDVQCEAGFTESLSWAEEEEF